MSENLYLRLVVALHLVGAYVGESFAGAQPLIGRLRVVPELQMRFAGAREMLALQREPLRGGTDPSRNQNLDCARQTGCAAQRAVAIPENVYLLDQESWKVLATLPLKAEQGGSEADVDAQARLDPTRNVA